MSTLISVCVFVCVCVYITLNIEILHHQQGASKVVGVQIVCVCVCPPHITACVVQAAAQQSQTMYQTVAASEKCLCACVCACAQIPRGCRCVSVTALSCLSLVHCTIAWPCSTLWGLNPNRFSSLFLSLLLHLPGRGETGGGARGRCRIAEAWANLLERVRCVCVCELSTLAAG